MSLPPGLEEPAYPIADLALARRLERAEAMANAAYVDARRLLEPAGGAEWINVAGVHAMFDGPASPLTQTFGLGLFEPCSVSEFDRLEDFFFRRAAPAFHEVSAFASPHALSLLSSRGYSPIEASTVLVRPTSEAHGAESSKVSVRIVDHSEGALWSRIAARGWSSESAELAAFVDDFGRVMTRARDVYCFLAELDGQPVAAAALNVSDGVALLAGASTVPQVRRQGAQRALLQSRLAFAAERGLDLAMVVTQPGSASQRNAERQGFRAAYTRAKWKMIQHVGR